MAHPHPLPDPPPDDSRTRPAPGDRRGGPATPPDSLRPIQEIPDAELDRFILLRLEMLGVDLSVLPEDDPDAPADRRRILASARRFLRTSPAVIADFPMDPQEVAPVLYPASVPRTGGEG